MLLKKGTIAHRLTITNTTSSFPKDLSAKKIEAFLTHLAVDRKVAASTQNQAFNALLFLYEQVLKINAFNEINAMRAKQPLYVLIHKVLTTY